LAFNVCAVASCFVFCYSKLAALRVSSVCHDCPSEVLGQLEEALIPAPQTSVADEREGINKHRIPHEPIIQLERDLRAQSRHVSQYNRETAGMFALTVDGADGDHHC
jgi:hypothetical protein